MEVAGEARENCTWTALDLYLSSVIVEHCLLTHLWARFCSLFFIDVTHDLC